MVRFGASGFLEEGIIGEASLTEVDFPNDFKPQLQKVKREPLTFSRQIVLVDSAGIALKWTETDRQNIFSWLFHNEYKPLIFEDRPDVVYYAIATGGLTLNTINEKGYLEVTFRTNSPFPWKIPRSIVVNANASTWASSVISVDANIALDKLYPTILLERVGPSYGTQVGAYTTGNAATTFMLSEALLPDTITKVSINTRNRTVIDADTKISLYRYKLTTSGNQWLSFIPGNNTIYITQGWKATISFQEPIIY